MKAGPECPECLRKLFRQATELATSDPKVRSKIEAEASKILGRLSPETVPTDLSNEFYRATETIAKNPDPFRERKLDEMKRARRAFEKIKPKDDLRSCIRIAAQGNAIDFFVSPDTLDRELSNRPNFAIDDIAKLERKLESAKDILYLADNAAEVYFDLPLLGYLSRRAKVRYVVKEKPVQNDLSMDDLGRAGVDIPVEVIASPPTVGFYLELAPPELRRRFEHADIVIAKGMGHYETLTELPQKGRFFYIFRAKCAPVARSLDVDLNDYVAVLR